MTKPPQQSPDFPDSFYRVTQKGAYVRDGKILMTKDPQTPSLNQEWEWELPGGGLDFGESFEEGLKREVREEMGLKVTSVGDKPVYLWTQRRENRRGMNWFYILALVYKIDLADLNFIPTKECSEIRFFSKEDLVREKGDIANQLWPLIDMFNPKDFE